MRSKALDELIARKREKSYKDLTLTASAVNAASKLMNTRVFKQLHGILLKLVTFISIKS